VPARPILALPPAAPTRLALARPVPTIAVVSTYPPTQCGLATYAKALVDAMRSVDDRPYQVIDAVEAPDRRRGHRSEVRQQLVAGNRASLLAAADVLDRADVAIVQHEYGIFGGPDGDEVLELLDATRTRVMTVLHTVAVSPTPRQRSILEALAARSDVVVTMSDAARQRLLARFAVDASRVCVIPHGAHENRTFGPWRMGEPPTILTWGLLGPGKGIETAIDALAELSTLIPALRYVIAGETHPKVRAASGEAYREALRARADAAGVGHLVEFDAAYRDVASLKALVRDADVVLLPYESREQVTSGVLVEAVASGKPVVATAFPHAVELLSAGAGLVVPHGDPPAMATALTRILTDPALARRMAAASALLAAPMLWPAVGARFLALADAVAAQASAVA